MGLNTENAKSFEEMEKEMDTTPETGAKEVTEEVVEEPTEEVVEEPTDEKPAE